VIAGASGRFPRGTQTRQLALPDQERNTPPLPDWVEIRREAGVWIARDGERVLGFAADRETLTEKFLSPTWPSSGARPGLAIFAGIAPKERTINSYLLNRLLRKPAKIRHTRELRYDTGLKTCAVLVPRLEYEHKVYSNNAYQKPPAPDVLRLPPSHAKQFWEKNQIQIFRGGACDRFKIGQLWGYRIWKIGPEEPARDGFEGTWIRCRLSKFITPVPGLEPDVLLESAFICSGVFCGPCSTRWKARIRTGMCRSKLRYPQLLSEPEAEPAKT